MNNISQKRGFSQINGHATKERDAHKRQRVTSAHNDSKRQEENPILNLTPTSPSPCVEGKQPSYQRPSQPYTGHRSTLPPLPPILAADLATIPFTHQGSLHGSTASKIHTSYERLEFFGDAYIEVIATRFVYSLYPDLPPGRLSQLREYCVKNETLADYATAYDFPERAHVPRSINKKDSRKVWIKTMGDIFEAYVAAIILSDPEAGFQTAEAWLTTLWAYELSKEHRTSKIDTQVHKSNAKTDLAKAIGGRDVRIEYRDEAKPEMVKHLGKTIFNVGVYLTGWGWIQQYLASGSALNKQEAGAEAAAKALENPLLKEVTVVKKKHDTMVAEARERGQEPPPFRTEEGRGHSGTGRWVWVED